MVMLEMLIKSHFCCTLLFDKGFEHERQTITTTFANIPTHHHHHHCSFIASTPRQGQVIVRLGPGFSLFGFNYLLFLADSPVAAIGVYVLGSLCKWKKRGF